MTADVPALVLGGGINGLGVARSLARAQVPTWLLDADLRRAEMHTRLASVLPVRALHGESLIDDLIRLSASRFGGSRPVLFATREDTVRTLSRYRHRLTALYRFTLPPRNVLEALTHKHGFQQLAERFGAPIPPLVRVRAVEDLAALEALRYPVVVKPGERHASYGRQFRKAYRIDNAAEAVDLVRRILPVMPDVVVQEWIEGADADIYFCLQYRDTGGNTSASFTGRKIRSWPPQVGGTASCVAAAEAHAELVEMTSRFFRDAGVVGMASMEYKRDARSGAFRMVEPTIGRSDYQEEVATLNGVNMPYAAYCAELGLAVPTPTLPKHPVVWRVRSEDKQSATAQDQPRGQGCPRGAHVVDALWRWSDPMPLVVQCLRRARRALFRRTTKSVPLSQTTEGSR
ncbi:MAG TPA: FAD-dependent oxidoreductase [Oleiagrimonas sp.]|nr:FAD-dependent oxidoreductase [Oleiagrimonas sp.]